MSNRHLFNAKLWVYPGETGNWHFVTLPKEVAAEIKEANIPRRGFGSVPVIVTVGKTEWNTSTFPDKVSHSYLLPIKAKVRKQEDLEAGDVISVSIQVR